MNVTTEDIRNIKPGTIKPFVCEGGRKLQTASVLARQLKRLGMPDGVVNYETQIFYDDNIILIHAMKEGDEKVLNR